MERSRDDLPGEVEFSNMLRSVLSYPVGMVTFYVHPSRSPCEGCICVAGNVSMWCQFCDVKSRGSILAERHRMLWMLPSLFTLWKNVRGTDSYAQNHLCCLLGKTAASYSSESLAYLLQWQIMEA